MISLATKEDIEKSAELAKQFYKENQLGDVFHMEHFTKTWVSFLEAGRAIVVKRETDGRLMEAIGALIYEDPVSKRLMGAVNFWFTRGTPCGLEGGMAVMALFNQLRERDVKTIFFAVSFGHNYQRMSRFLESVGFVPVEANYRLDL